MSTEGGSCAKWGWGPRGSCWGVGRNPSHFAEKETEAQERGGLSLKSHTSGRQSRD